MGSTSANFWLLALSLLAGAKLSRRKLIRGRPSAFYRGTWGQKSAGERRVPVAMSTYTFNARRSTTPRTRIVAPMKLNSMDESEDRTTAAAVLTGTSDAPELASVASLTLGRAILRHPSRQQVRVNPMCQSDAGNRHAGAQTNLHQGSLGYFAVCATAVGRRSQSKTLDHLDPLL
jgi:hypothetical protein